MVVVIVLYVCIMCIYIYIYTHTHPHMYIYIYIYILYVPIFICNKKGLYITKAVRQPIGAGASWTKSGFSAEV